MHTPLIAVASVLLAALLIPALPQPTAQPERPLDPAYQPKPKPTAPPDDKLTGSSAVPNPSNTDAACQLRLDMRKLWTDHTVWTRDYIIAAVDEKADQEAAANRLMKNQEDIGTALATYYGKGNGDRLTNLLKDHIKGATEVVKAAKTKDASQLKAADERWKQNAEDIADFLSGANPAWTRAAMREMMMTHLATTTDEVNARIKQDWDGDVKAYDKVYEHILKMSDALTDGIARQFPDRFGMPKTK